MEKMFVYFSTKAKFLAATQGTEYNYTSIVFIADSKEIWNRGMFYATPNDFNIGDYLTKLEAGNLYQPKGNYLTQHQSLEDYYTKAEVDEAIEGVDVSDQLKDYVKLEKFVEDLAKKADKTEIPSLDGYATEDWVGKQGFLKDHQSLDDYATNESVASKVQEIEGKIANVKSEILGGAGEDYDTLKEIEAWIGKHGSAYEALVSTVGQKASKEEMATAISEATNDMATQTWVKGQNYLTAVPEEYAKKSDLPTDYLTEEDLKGYATEAFVSEKVTDIVTGGEIELTGYAKSADVTEEIGAAVAGLSETYYTKSEVDAMFEWAEY